MTTPRRPTTRKPRPRATGYFRALETGFEEGTSRVHEMHRAIAEKSFRVLRAIPAVSGPAKLVEDAHRVVTGGVYATVRHTGAALLAAAGSIEEHRAASRAEPADAKPGTRSGGIRAAINGVFGDFLAASDNPLAIEMGFYAAGRRIELSTDSIAANVAEPNGRICVFVHGLACDESSWQRQSSTPWDSPGQHYGERLQAEFGYTPLYLRYNTGLPIADNGLLFAQQLTLLLDTYPVPPRELVLIGHSLGGLVARSACHQAAARGLPWLHRTRVVVCLGSPNLGAPLEKLGYLAAGALHLSDVTAPLGKIADARSAAIKDLRHGLRRGTRTGKYDEGAPPVPGIAYRFLAANVVADCDRGFGRVLGRVVGDGLVTQQSAAVAGLPGDVETATIGGVGHLQLLNEPRVYAYIRRWLGARHGTAQPF